MAQWYRVGFRTNADKKFCFEYGQIMFYVKNVGALDGFGIQKRL